jgi:hypothetical protein
MPPPKGSKPLTEVAVRNLKPGATLADIGEHRGLRVNKTRTGTTTFFYRYRCPDSSGKICQLRFGRYPFITLAAAHAERVTPDGVSPYQDQINCGLQGWHQNAYYSRIGAGVARQWVWCCIEMRVGKWI